jgi:hypothetical protein
MLQRNDYDTMIFHKNLNSDVASGLICPTLKRSHNFTNDGADILNDLYFLLKISNDTSYEETVSLSSISVNCDEGIEKHNNINHLYFMIEINGYESHYERVYLTEHSLNQICAILFRAGIKINATLLKSLPTKMACRVLNSCIKSYSFFTKNKHSDEYDINDISYKEYALSQEDYFIKVKPNRVVDDKFIFYITYRGHDVEKYILNSVNSIKYTRIKNLGIVHNIIAFSKTYPNLVVSKVHHQYHCLAIKLINTDHPIQLDPNNADDIGYLGLEIINSEIGTKKLTIRQTIFRKVCKNGMWGFDTTSVYSKKHIGQEIRSYRSRLKDKLLNLAYADDTGARILSRKFAIAQRKLEATNDAERDAFLKRLGLKEREIETAIVCHATEEKKDMRSAFDFVQAVTAAARISSTVERRSELEEIAGNYFRKVTA